MSSNPKTKARGDMGKPSAELAFASDSNFFSSYTASSLHNSFPYCNQERGVDRETPGTTQKVCGMSGVPASNNDPQTQSLDKPRVPCLNQ